MLALVFQAGALLAVTFLLFSYAGWWLGTKRDPRKRAVHMSLEDAPAPVTAVEASEPTIEPFMGGTAEAEPETIADEEIVSGPAETSPVEDVPAEDNPTDIEPAETVVAQDATPDPDPNHEPEPEPAPKVEQPVSPPRPEPGQAQTVTGRLHIDPTPRGLQRQEVAKPAQQVLAAVSPEPAPEPAPEPIIVPVVEPAPETAADDLTKITGISAATEAQLNALGILNYQQIAEWTPQQRDEISAKLRFPHRAIRENWIDQAALLSENPSDKSV